MRDLAIFAVGVLLSGFVIYLLGYGSKIPKNVAVSIAYILGMGIGMIVVALFPARG